MKNLLLLFVWAFLALLAACSSDGTHQKEDGSPTENNSISSQSDKNSGKDAPANIQEAMEQVQDAVKKMNNGEQVEVVSFRKLQELMPENLNAYERTQKSGETTGAMGMKVSTAKATYQNGDQKIDLEIMDTGGLGMAMMGLAAWTTVTVDREDENGYERTGVLDGYKAYETFKNNGGKSEVNLIINDRFIVKASSRLQNEAQMKEMKNFIKNLDLDKLEKM